MSQLKARVASMVFAFDDADRQDAVRALARDVGALEARLAALRAAGNALARHVAEDTRGQTERQLVQAWEEASK